jgi:hypothetical protein
MRYRRAVVMEAAPRELGVDVVQAFGFGEPVFFPEFLDDASAGFGSGGCGLPFDCLSCELGVFEPGCDGCEDVVNGCLDLVFLRLYFEFYVAYSHFDFDGWFFGVFCHGLAYGYCILCCTRCTSATVIYFTNRYCILVNLGD